ncbi:DUF3592 domain-containing protein [Patescibacteria group bacterium]|nr:DUF3592 domain-containing protein [Patescibacteria group bacterium]
MNVVLFLIGLVFLGFGIFQFLKSKKLVSNGVTSTAKIIEIRQKKSQTQDDEGYTTTSYSYAPVFEFETKNGEKYTVESKHGFANKNKFRVGESVEIIYLEEKPQDACIKKFGSLWSLPIILILVGIMLVVASFVS